MCKRKGNGGGRGSSYDRRARKEWLLKEFGDGFVAPCMMDEHAPDCPGFVRLEDMSVDRWPVPGSQGGRYVRGNIRPAYGPCNFIDGNRLKWGKR
jgi:hypothetical protein